jgi:hypothetical protein
MASPAEVEVALDPKTFGDLLMRCLSLEDRRRLEKHGQVDSTEFEAIRTFCKQPISDSQYLLNGTIPSVIAEQIGKSRRDI